MQFFFNRSANGEEESQKEGRQEEEVDIPAVADLAVRDGRDPCRAGSPWERPFRFACKIARVKLHPSAALGRNAVTSYGEGYVTVAGRRHESSVIVLPEEVLPWEVRGFDKLEKKDFEFLRTLKTEIVILGTGPAQRFPRPELAEPLIRAGIGLEAMALQAACRTFNILLAEERKVALALLFA